MHTLAAAANYNAHTTSCGGGGAVNYDITYCSMHVSGHLGGRVSVVHDMAKAVLFHPPYRHTLYLCFCLFFLSWRLPAASGRNGGMQRAPHTPLQTT